MNMIGQPFDRTDGLLKVTGEARYAAEFPEARLAHAVLVTSTIARGTIASIDMSRAQAMPGVLLVMTHENAPRLPNGGKAQLAPPAGRRLSLLQDNEVHYSNEPVAVVVADTLEHATDAARQLRITYRAAAATLDFAQAKANAHAPDKPQGRQTDTQRGSFEDGLQSGAVHIDATYTTPIEHHNPMEPHATMARWDGPQLTLYDSTQGVSGEVQAVAKTLGISPADVRVISPFVGGGFGCKGSSWSHVSLCAMAAKQTGRPVRLVLERPQMFGPVGARPRTEQRLVLAARRDGTLTAMRHDSVSNTSMIEDWTETCCMVTRMLYAVPNQQTTHRLVPLNVGTPTFMRAPGETTGSFALESAMDELAVALRMDPLALRLKNYAEVDPQENKPWSGKSLRECYQAGAEKFGWSRRNPAPRSMRDGNTLIGMGMATATYPANRSEAGATARILPDGTAMVASGTQDIGTGTYTVMTQVAADALGFAPENIRFALGDSSLPKAPVSGGSQSAASVAPAVREAANAARAQLIALALADPASPVHGLALDDITVENGWVTSRSQPARRDPAAAIIARSGGKPIEATSTVKPGDEKQKYSFHSFGAVFVEVRVDADLGTIRVPRVVGVYDVGRVLNAKTARSQMLGGIVWGVGAALQEESWLDTRYGRFTNANLAEYHVPVNADIGSLDITFLDRPDPHINSLGVRGIGEIGITGVCAALANAVYHATGVRVRDLPVTLDKVMQTARV
ncbi:xanthine dehydrogenase family protein molybdopterin-binding subunit [bacterium M00.F.Ca.ET.228.01.1.1]|uniref:xanthine dehydrogenase family protein molybdopterin-binding subunit n=1 Tax=Paraburkholderia phenoliruptrix TaxID=252970 RepID=UPI00109284EB|nr:xanthine dehydrogenase family protein molybdopterin-binding subunit [Paraburkholderia phenoliruptrix]TGP40128.1 xanthine dehydrogenase family protein molybdopterin-binding subunit [bacterium M00.F.Ca.ET.228.01.1.1]TGR96103.1 xanthine dehydrogenase family protein molybdopterin-binding subunit [bacterium M00.F.Ca.ET.191.01.1.1]TGT97240.1 xanthine dehydrogenase family protein molybdopterin-binding subunit [bacterium M00.F.Ca.ET.155.01.1.1]MBW0450718.1 xanthine dehydrogenase family protein molyb